MNLLTAAQMKRLEQAAMEAGKITGEALMERAGAAVVEAVLEKWPDLAAGGHQALVLCGPGNNGGDGFVIARLLAARGWEIDLRLYGAPERLPPDAATNHRRWLEHGDVIRLDGGAPSPWPLAPDLVVDALFGIGLRWQFDLSLDPCFAGLDYRPEREASESGAVTRIVAVDLPSGLCSDTGRDRGVILPADLTVTFHTAKLGHYLAEGPEFCGDVVVKGIGLPPVLPRAMAPKVVTLVRPLAPGELAAPGRINLPALRKRGLHKFTHGHALILGGHAGRTGAARLSARGALRVGAGLVTLASPLDAMDENAARLDAIMLREVNSPADLEALLQDRRINALCLGPALGLGDAEARLVAQALSKNQPLRRPTVLDADALHHLAQDNWLFGQLHAGCVLTPHGGEFAQLFQDLALRLQAEEGALNGFSKTDAVREVAARAGCTVLLKGADTVVAAPDGRCAVHAAVYEREAPWLATAGSGDVLAGFITGLMARGFSPFDAACTGAWLHAECAIRFGPGLIAEDLPEALPGVFRDLGIR